MLLETWYARVDVLRCYPDTCQAFHFLLLIEALTGARPGSLGQFTYQDFELVLQRDPDDRDVKFLAIHMQMHRNKQK